MDIKDKIMVALDVDSLDKAEKLVSELFPYVGCFKIGLELITAAGALSVTKMIRSYGGEVFYDGKFCDIPNTIGAAVRSASNLKVKYLTVHASAGVAALKAAVLNKGESKIIAVTVLTSIDDANSNLIFGSSAKEKVLQFVRDAKNSNCDGIVCSPQELTYLQGKEFENLIKIVPGVRPVWADQNDQKRTMTPKEAFRNGASILVIGRPITNPPEGIAGTLNSIRKIQEEIS